jgi:shikimate kinase
MQTVILIGPPNCGKTTLGELTAQKLGIRFEDTDKLAMQKLKELHPNPESRFFERARYFSDFEHEVLQELADEKNPMIIATGAETALSPKNTGLLKQIGYIVLLRRNKELLKEELANQTGPRWIMISGTGENEKRENADAFFTDTYYDLMPQYERIADAVLENDSGIENGIASLIEIFNAGSCAKATDFCNRLDK